jgi:5-hydroxyisourate hydrolase
VALNRGAGPGAITTHVLDTMRGLPARGLPVRLEVLSGKGRFRTLAHAVTDATGRIDELGPEGPPRRGLYRLTFDTAAYCRSAKTPCFFPSVTVLFAVDGSAEHYHVPLLLSPFGYSIYRGM